MKNSVLTYLKRIGFLAIVSLLPFFAATETIQAADCTANCGVEWKSCPRNEDGTLKRRNDISVSCLKKLNSAKENCVNTMPVNGYVDRVPEDLCMRSSTRHHYGMDYAVVEGTEVTAAAKGTVIETNTCSDGYGLKIVIQHERKDGKGDSYISLYAHLSEINVVHGQEVEKGEVIGKSGSTSCDGTPGGTAWKTGDNHLHFELRTSNGGTVINPMCDDIQALCGECSNTFDPNQCRVDCEKNPESDICKAAKNDTNTSSIPYNARPSTSGSSFTPTNVGNAPVVQSSGGSTTGGKCDINSYRDSFNSCIFCDLFRILFDTASILAKKAYTSLSDAMINLVIIGMALWLAITILKFVSAFDVKEPRILIKTILNQAFVVFVVVTILRYDIQEFIDLIVEPIFNTGMALAQMVTSGQDGQTCTGFTQVTTEGGIPASIGNNILCTIQSIQGKLLDIMTLGSSSLCIAFRIESYKELWIFPHPGYLITGLLLWLSAILLMFIYPWLLIDSILQLSIASALIPVAIAAYAFPITRKKYVTKVWETFMTAMFTFLFLSLVIFIITTGMEQTVSSIMTDQLKNAGVKGNNYNIILDVVNGIAWWSVKTLELVFWMLLGWAVLDQAKEFAGNFSKGGFNIKSIGTPFGGMANNVAKAAALGTGGKVLGGAKWAGKQMGAGLHDMAHSAKVNRMANRALNSSNAQTNEDGSVTATVRNWYGRKTTRTVTRDASGNLSVQNQRSRIKGLGFLSHDRTTITDKYMTVKNQYDKHGNLLKQKFKMDSAACRTMTNRDGSLNTVAVNLLQQNSTLDKDTVNTAILNQVLKERMPNSALADMETNFAAREVVYGDDGSFTIKQTNTDGSTTNFSMKIDGGNIMTSVEQIKKNGTAVKYSSDGIIHKRSTYTYVDGKINASSVKNKYAFADYYTKYDSRPIDSNGRFSNAFPKDRVMFGQDDLDLLTEQIALYGQPKAMSEFSK